MKGNVVEHFVILIPSWCMAISDRNKKGRLFYPTTQIEVDSTTQFLWLVVISILSILCKEVRGRVAAGVREDIVWLIRTQSHAHICTVNFCFVFVLLLCFEKHSITLSNRKLNVWFYFSTYIRPRQCIISYFGCSSTSDFTRSGVIEAPLPHLSSDTKSTAEQRNWARLGKQPTETAS